MRGSILGSGLAHVALIVFLLVVRAPVPMIVPGPDVVQVALLDPSAAIAVPPPAPKPPPEPEPSPIAPEEEEGVKLDPPKPPKKKPKEKPKEETPPQRLAAALPEAAVGSAGLRGDLALDDSSFEFTYYLVLVRNKIASTWTPPTGLTSGRPVRAVVHFKIGRGGDVLSATLESSSGIEFFDRSALRAVTLSDPLPPLPLGFAGGTLGVHFGFTWEAP